MKLLELQPKFLKITQHGTWESEGISISEADGIIFLCPVCFKQNGGPIGTHSIICWKPHVPETQSPGPGRWNMLGRGLADLTLHAGSSSIFLTTAPCKAHFFITEGEIR